MPEARKLAMTMATPTAAATAPSTPRNNQPPRTMIGPTTAARRTMCLARLASTSARIVSVRNRPHSPESNDRPGDDPDDDHRRIPAESLVGESPEDESRHDRTEKRTRLGTGGNVLADATMYRIAHRVDPLVTTCDFFHNLLESITRRK